MDKRDFLKKFLSIKNSPDIIVEARILKWTWTALEPVGYINRSDSNKVLTIYGFAIYQYDGYNEFLRF